MKDLKENIWQSERINPVLLLQEIWDFAESMTYHAEQIAPRTVERTYDPNYKKYEKLLQYLSEK
jgi:hypothetical protein